MCVLYRELCPPVPEYRQVKCIVWCLLEVCVQWKELCPPVPGYRQVKCTVWCVLEVRVQWKEQCPPVPEAEFLDEIGTKVARVFLLAINSHLY